jgi:hypothetical protein
MRDFGQAAFARSKVIEGEPPPRRWPAWIVQLHGLTAASVNWLTPGAKTQSSDGLILRPTVKPE